MRISDWSSDVCSSDLLVDRLPRHARPHIVELLDTDPADRQRLVVEQEESDLDTPARRAVHLLARLGIARRPDPDAHRDRTAARAVEFEAVEALDERRRRGFISSDARRVGKQWVVRVSIRGA